MSRWGKGEERGEYAGKVGEGRDKIRGLRVLSKWGKGRKGVRVLAMWGERVKFGEGTKSYGEVKGRKCVYQSG